MNTILFTGGTGLVGNFDGKAIESLGMSEYHFAFLDAKQCTLARATCNYEMYAPQTKILEG